MPKCLEVGSGGGALQDITEDYTGLDLAESCSKHYHKPFIQGSATEMPIRDDSFDMVWSIAALEHVPNPQKAFEEIIRVTRNNGYILLSPAWHCRRWAAQGYEVRPYSDFNIFGKIYKFMIPLLDNIILRAICIIPIRVWGSILFVLKKDIPFLYTKLKPQYEVHRTSDDDACNSMDPYMAILFFEARGHKCVSHKSLFKKITSTHGFVTFRVKK